MVSSSRNVLLKLPETTSPPKLFPSDCIIIKIWYIWSLSLDALLKLSKKPYPKKLFDYDYFIYNFISSNLFKLRKLSTLIVKILQRWKLPYSCPSIIHMYLTYKFGQQSKGCSSMWSSIYLILLNLYLFNTRWF